MKNKRSLMRSFASLPHIVWAVLFIVAPLIFVVYYAFTDYDGNFTFNNILGLSEYGETFLLSVELALIATVVCFAIGYPIAYIMARSDPRKSRICMLLLMLPMWTNLLIRTYSVMAILDDGGFLNHMLAYFDMKTVHIIGTKGAVIFGMVYDFLPFMILPIYNAIAKIGNDYLEAASDLGCSGLRVLTKVVFPLSVSGIVSGITMVFVPSISTFYISQKLGGGTFELIGDTIERQFQNSSTYNIGAAVSLVMTVLLIISLIIADRFTDKDEVK